MPSISAYWIDRVLFDVHHVPGHLARYKENPDVYMAETPLPEALKAAIRDNEIGQMYLAGANPYLLRAHCLGLHISELDFLASLKAVSKEAGYG
jgi:Aromatic-ring-opening dioxygenase LigAB, LigA subunit